MTTDWRRYWAEHVDAVGRDDPLRRVQRTQGGQPIGEAIFERQCERMASLLSLRPDHELLDLCCGNGVVTVAIERYCQRVVGVDFNEPLLEDFVALTTRTEAVCADARDVEFAPGSFDRVLIAGALQHFTPAEAVRMLKKSRQLLRPTGVLLVTDIPDRARIWNFFDDENRRAAYFDSLERDETILGTWFDKTWLEQLSRHAGFVDAEMVDQPADFPDSHFRFDLCCYRSP